MSSPLKVLIIDDSGDKIRNVGEAIRSSTAYSPPEIETAGDLHSARKAMRGTRFDLVILDVNLPRRAGEPPSAEQFEGFLADIARDRAFKKPLYLIGLTAFGDLFERANAIFATHGWLLFSVEYHRTTWPNVITDRLRFLTEQKADLRADAAADYEFDIGIVTALATPELAAILEWPVKWATTLAPADFVEYQCGTLSLSDRSFRVVAASCQHMGLVASTTLATKLCKAFSPRLLAMVGIAAGVRTRTNIGDLLVIEESWDYNSGKLGRQGDHRTFEPDPKSIRISPELCERFQNPERNASIIGKAFESWKGPLPSERPKVRVGPVASGSSVVADAGKVSEIAAHNRKLVGLEMETYGIYFAAENALRPKPEFISLKSVCDFADDKKSDGFQTYAAHISANFLLEALKSGLLPVPQAT